MEYLFGANGNAWQHGNMAAGNIRRDDKILKLCMDFYLQIQDGQLGICLFVQEHRTQLSKTVDGSGNPANHLGCIKPY